MGSQGQCGLTEGEGQARLGAFPGNEGLELVVLFLEEGPQEKMGVIDHFQSSLLLYLA